MVAAVGDKFVTSVAEAIPPCLKLLNSDPEHPRNPWRCLASRTPPPDIGSMYYAPRYSPDKAGMPVLGYFSVVGGLLLGLLFVADAYMPRNEQLSFASNVDGLPAAYKGEPAHVPAAAPHIAPPPAIAEITGSSGGFALAAEEPKRTTPLAAAPVAQEAPKPAKPKVVVVRRRHVEPQEDSFGQFGRQDYARQDYGRQDYGRQDYGRRQDFGFRSREPSSREPSWRDSWASGAFQGEPRSRRSSRSGNDFGSFGSFR
jgi:hypothetical protein